MSTRLLIASLLLTSLLGCGANPARQADITHRARSFQDRMAAIDEGREVVVIDEVDARLIPASLSDHDRMIFKALLEFEKTVQDDELPGLAKFAKSADGTALRLPVATILIDRQRHDLAAQVIVTALLEIPENRSYRLWKWWDVNYRDRGENEFKAMSRRFTDALLVQFDRGPSARREVVAELFDQPKSAASLDLASFKKAIGYNHLTAGAGER